MNISKSIVLVVVSTAITASFILGLALIPGGERIGVLLHQTAHRYFAEPIEQSLKRELDALQYQSQRTMLAQLAIQHIAEQARQARLQAVSQQAKTVEWHTTVATAGQADTGLFVNAVPPPPNGADEELGLTAPILLFIFAAFWMVIRRSRV